MGGAPLHPLVLHEDTHWHRQNCWSSHLVRISVGLGLRDKDGLWLLLGLRLHGRDGLGVCGRLRQYVRIMNCGWLAGLLTWSGADRVFFRWADGEERSTIHMHPLHISSEISQRTAYEQADSGWGTANLKFPSCGPRGFALSAPDRATGRQVSPLIITIIIHSRFSIL